MEDCIFCKIVKGEIPCQKVYEDDKILAFLDIMPVHKGHTLVIPKEHHTDILDMPDDTLAELAKVAKKVSKAVKEATKADGFNIGQNNGAAAGQAVFHFHLHVIPRFNNDGLKTWPHGKLPDEEMNAIHQAIKNSLE
ncbi:HIT family protein [Candidatus Woesearchaeota archaeon]|jgi:histidine triad (HIT) family protein|nr:HIT family protein [Candidatus Woesearchaeota archaeon]MBW3005761.1 HIT family protein [Candidatus Woesearchaeota archaeon]